jgi:hypothetical protein
MEPEGFFHSGFGFRLLPYRPAMQPCSSAFTTLEVSTSPLPVQSSRSRICTRHRGAHTSHAPRALQATVGSC